jgi:hypothetical protein
MRELEVRRRADNRAPLKGEGDREAVERSFQDNGEDWAGRYEAGKKKGKWGLKV